MCQLRARYAKDAAAGWWRMAQEYQELAAKLDNSNGPDIGEKPFNI